MIDKKAMVLGASVALVGGLITLAVTFLIFPLALFVLPFLWSAVATFFSIRHSTGRAAVQIPVAAVLNWILVAVPVHLPIWFEVGIGPAPFSLIASEELFAGALGGIAAWAMQRRSARQVGGV